MLTTNDLSISIGDKDILINANLNINDLDKIGLIGRNGAGKTTTVNTLAGISKNYTVSGTINGNRGNENFGYLPQDTHVADPSIDTITYILSARGLDKVENELKQVYLDMASNDPKIVEKAMEDYPKIEQKYINRGGYEAKSEAEEMINALGLPPEIVDKEIGKLSGGQRRRVELVKILFSNASTLILDEPTNHLDKDSIAWLKDFIKEYKGGILIITHDIALLSQCCNKIWHFNTTKKNIEVFNMPYSRYLKTLSQETERIERETKVKMDEASRLLKQGNKMRAKATKAVAAKQMLKRAEELMDSIEVQDKKDKVADLRFPDPLKSYRLLLEFKDLSKSYEDKQIFKNISLTVERGSKVAILGLNGAGKTTLLKLIVGDIKQNSGDIKYGNGLKIGYFAQEHDKLFMEKTLLENMLLNVPDEYSEEDCRNVLGSFKFSGDSIYKKARVLSGGEKTRLALATLVVSGANLLLLDEPTNNLDPESRDEILKAIQLYKGATLLVTHDLGAIDALDPDRVLLLPSGQEDIFKEKYRDFAKRA